MDAFTTRICGLLAKWAFDDSMSLIRYREWAQDKRCRYRDRLRYDGWSAAKESNIIDKANRIIANLERSQ